MKRQQRSDHTTEHQRTTNHQPYRVNELIQQIRRGHDEAWDELYARYRDASLEFCTRVLGDRDLAEDAFQESFLEVSRKMDDLRHQEAFTVWFRRILIKHCDRIRRVTRPTRSLETESSLLRHRVQAPDPEIQPALYVERGEMNETILRALKDLPDTERRLCVEYYLEERDQHEISRRTGLPLHTVKNRLYQARRILRRQLDAYRPYGPTAMAA